MNTKDLIEAAKFQASVKPQDEFMREVAERLETLYEENNRQKTEIERLQKLYAGADACVDELEYAFDKVGHSNTRVDYALEKYRNLVKEMVGEG